MPQTTFHTPQAHIIVPNFSRLQIIDGADKDSWISRLPVKALKAKLVTIQILN